MKPVFVVFLSLLALSGCAAGKIRVYQTNFELNDRAISQAAGKVQGLPSNNGKTLAIIPATGLRGYNQFPQQAIENRLATNMIRQGYTPMERVAEIVKALALNADGFGGGVFPYISGNGQATYNADLVPGARAPGDLKLASPNSTYAGGSEKTVAPEVLHFLANPGITKVFNLPQPDYFLTYDVISTGIRYVEEEPKLGIMYTKRLAQARLFLKLIDAKTAGVLYAQEVSAAIEDVVPRSALSMLEKPAYDYYGPALYGKPIVDNTATLSADVTKGITSVRQVDPYAYPGGKYATLSTGLLTSDGVHFLLSPRFDWDFGNYIGARAGLDFASFTATAGGSGFDTSGSVTYLAPSVGLKLIAPLDESFLPYVQAGPALKIVSGISESNVTPAFNLGGGALIPIGSNLVLRGDLGASLSDSVEETLSKKVDDTTLKAVVTDIDGFQIEASIGVGMRF